MQSKIIIELMNEANKFIKENRENFNGLAVARTNEGEYLLGVEFFCVPLHQCLPAENSVMQEAEKKRQRISHLMCLSWENDEDPTLVVPAAESLDRLLKYGDKVNIALLSEKENIEFFEIRELFPANWYTLAMQDESFSVENDSLEPEKDAEAITENQPSDEE